ncbi:MAG: metallophosphoesterase [Myxococcales bacterium]|nr:metallophosphoesterase [Myxococcales bacterium]MCB9642705.1 metallophosphoesterase [Myxococcales bacterium]
MGKREHALCQAKANHASAQTCAGCQGVCEACGDGCSSKPSASASRTAKLQILWAFLVLILLMLSLVSCRFFIPVDELDANKRMELFPPQILQEPAAVQGKDSYSFVYFADIQVDERLIAERRAPAIAVLGDYLKKNPVDFMISGGDNTQSGTSEEYAFVDQEMKKLGLPIFWCVGNHDFFGDGWQLWRDYYGTTVRVIKLPHTSIYILDNGAGTFGEKQRLWFEEQLKQDTAKHRMAVMHFPIYGDVDYILESHAFSREDQTFASLFERYNVRHILMGHSHLYRSVLVNGIRYITASALKENSPSKMILRVDVDANDVKTTVVPIEVDGYLSWKVATP